MTRVNDHNDPLVLSACPMLIVFVFVFLAVVFIWSFLGALLDFYLPNDLVELLVILIPVIYVRLLPVRIMKEPCVSR